MVRPRAIPTQADCSANASHPPAANAVRTAAMNPNRHRLRRASRCWRALPPIQTITTQLTSIQPPPASAPSMRRLARVAVSNTSDRTRRAPRLRTINCRTNIALTSAHPDWSVPPWRPIVGSDIPEYPTRSLQAPIQPPAPMGRCATDGPAHPRGARRAAARSLRRPERSESHSRVREARDPSRETRCAPVIAQAMWTECGSSAGHYNSNAIDRGLQKIRGDSRAQQRQERAGKEPQEQRGGRAYAQRQAEGGGRAQRGKFHRRVEVHQADEVDIVVECHGAVDRRRDREDRQVRLQRRAEEEQLPDETEERRQAGQREEKHRGGEGGPPPNKPEGRRKAGQREEKHRGGEGEHWRASGEAAERLDRLAPRRLDDGDAAGERPGGHEEKRGGGEKGGPAGGG